MGFAPTQPMNVDSYVTLAPLFWWTVEGGSSPTFIQNTSLEKKFSGLSTFVMGRKIDFIRINSQTELWRERKFSSHPRQTWSASYYKLFNFNARSKSRQSAISKVFLSTSLPIMFQRHKNVELEEIPGSLYHFLLLLHDSFKQSDLEWWNDGPKSHWDQPRSHVSGLWLWLFAQHHRLSCDYQETNQLSFQN